MIGGKGYIGANLVEELKKGGNEVYTYDRKDGQEALNYRQLYDFLEKIKTKIVFDLANFPGHLESIKKPREFIHNNFVSVLNIAECARHLEFKIVFASSASVYGNQPVPWKEDMKPKIDSPYSFAKVISEDLLKDYYERYGVESIICRISTPYGGLNERSHKPIPILLNFIEKAKKKEKIVIYGLNRTRDFTHISDTIEGMILASKQKGFDIFNISCGKEYYFIDIAKKLACDNYEVRPIEELNKDVPERWLCDITKLKKLNFKPKIDLIDYLDEVKI